MNTIKIKTIFGQVLTIKVKEQTDEYISGFDKFGAFVKVEIKDIQNCTPISQGVEND